MKRLRPSIALFFLLFSIIVFADDVEENETNVIVLLCAQDENLPGNIRVEALSANHTRNFVPQIKRGTSCAQALHKYLTAGFKLTLGDLNLISVTQIMRTSSKMEVHEPRNRFAFVLTRNDRVVKIID